MPEIPVDSLDPQQLREKAELLLKSGNSMSGGGRFLSKDALSVLLKLASSSESATDSLKILHEFQTHQIELDLQLEQLENNERESATVLDHYQSLFEFAPIAYFIINRTGRITKSNQCAAALFGLDSDELEGRTLENFLTPDSHALINWQMEKLFRGSPCESCTVMNFDNNTLRSLNVQSNLAPAGDVIYMTVSEHKSRP